MMLSSRIAVFICLHGWPKGLQKNPRLVDKACCSVVVGCILRLHASRCDGDGLVRDLV